MGAKSVLVTTAAAATAAAAIAATAAAIAAAATATATATATAIAATTAATAIFARLGQIDREITVAQLLAVQALDGCQRFLGGAHGNESETAHLAGFPVGDKADFDDDAIGAEGVSHVGFSGVEGKISHV